MSNYPKVEKVNETTVRIVSEKVDEVPLKNLIANLDDLKRKREQINEVISNIEIILKNAEELGIVSEIIKTE